MSSNEETHEMDNNLTKTNMPPDDTIIDEENKEEQSIGVGDKIGIQSKKYGTISGRIYYISDDLIRIIPDGASDVLYDFPIVDGELEEDITFYEKGPRISFIELQGFRTGQEVEAIDATRNVIGTYEITNVNDITDVIELKHKETGDIKTLVFDGQGIPREEAFIILRILPDMLPNTGTEAKTEEEVKTEANEGEEVEVEAEAEIEEFELPPIEQVEIILAQERVYPEITQKSEFLADLLFLEDTKNPKISQKMFKLVEVFSTLKNSIIKRKKDGNIEGEEKISVSTLLDFLEKPNLPIVRPVLTTKRIIMTEFPDEEENDLEQVLIRRLDKYIDESNEYLNSMNTRPVSEIGLPRWFTTLEQYFTKYPLGDSYSNNGDYSFSEDGEYFRNFEPGSSKLRGLVRPEATGENTYEGLSPEEFIGPIEASLRRGHGPTVRGLVKGGTEVVHSGDRAFINGHVIFPYSAITNGYIGAIRSGILWNTVLRSSLNTTTNMQQILKKYDGISNILDAQNILFLQSETAVRILFQDYLKMILDTTIVQGPGDLIPVKYDLGIQEMEFNAEQSAIIEERVREVIASFRSFISSKRETIDQITPVMQSILGDEYTEELKRSIGLYTHLKEKLPVLEKRLSNYKDIDIAIFLFLYNTSQNYFLSCLSKNPKTIDENLKKYARDILLKQLKDRMLEYKLEQEKGVPPQPNPCEHTDILTQIRKIKDSTERIQALTKFVQEYKGGREENWILCGGRPGVPGCGQHLICHHELLQIQQYLHPREHQAIQKEIVLGYAGGTFGKNYICRNCGLPIAEMEYDMHVEFDDEGKPLMGRSELVDQEEADKKDLEELFGTDYETSELTFATKLSTEFYKIAIVICNCIGVAFDSATYLKLVERTEIFARQDIPSEAVYSKGGGKNYAAYVTRMKISIVAVFILLEIQCKTPDYKIQYVFDGCVAKDGCKHGFSGFPLVSDANPENEEESIGLHYITYVLSEFYPSFQQGSEQDAIWKEGFHLTKNKTQRRINVKNFIVANLKNILEKDTGISRELELKRKYLEQTIGGSKGRPGDKIPRNFLPRMEVNTDAIANSPTVEAGIKVKDEEHLADAWIRTVHEYAKETTLVMKGNPFAETFCCPSKLTEPGGFLREKALPELIPKSPVRRTFASTLHSLFIPRELQESIGEPSLELAYRVFLQVCWKGSRIGKTHELGHDNKCYWCDIEILNEYLYPDIYLEDPSWKPKRVQEEKEKQNADATMLESKIITSFETQGIPCTDKTGFQNILDASHKRTEFKDYKSPFLIPSLELIRRIVTIDYPPFENYQVTVIQTIENLKKLGDNSDSVSIANALHPMYDGMKIQEEYFKSKLGDKAYTFINNIIRDETHEAIIEIIRSYFLIPLQRIHTGYTVEEKMLVPKQYTKGKYEFSENHIKELNDIMLEHTAYDIQLEDDILLVKLDYFTNQVSSMLQYASEMRVSRIQDDIHITKDQKSSLLKAILYVTIFGPLYNLLNASFIPETEEELDDTNTFVVHNELLKIVKTCVQKLFKERIVYNPTQVREEIAKAKEREKQGIVRRRFDSKDSALRQIEIIKKRLGTGDWAIGGTKLVYSYDADQWDKNRVENIDNVMHETGNLEGEGEGYDTYDGPGNDED